MYLEVEIRRKVAPPKKKKKGLKRLPCSHVYWRDDSDFVKCSKNYVEIVCFYRL